MFDLIGGLSWSQLWHLSGVLNMIDVYFIMVISWVLLSDKHYYFGGLFVIDFFLSFYVSLTWSSAMPIDYAMIWESLQWKSSFILLEIAFLFFYRKRTINGRTCNANYSV